jgi:hypothetical protein
MHGFFMGYGYGYKIFNPLKTRTCTAYPCTHSQKRTISKWVTVEDSDEDEEPGHAGETLDADGDAVMELAGDSSEKHSAGEDPIELTDIDDVEEDEDGEISELIVTVIIVSLWRQCAARMTHERLDHSGLCILQAYSNCGIHWGLLLPHLPLYSPDV